MFDCPDTISSVFVFQLSIHRIEDLPLKDGKIHNRQSGAFAVDQFDSGSQLDKDRAGKLSNSPAVMHAARSPASQVMVLIGPLPILTQKPQAFSTPNRLE